MDRHVKRTDQRGQVLMGTLSFTAIAVFFIVGLVSWVLVVLRANVRTYQREVALQAAEAGVEYYRWHLAHSPVDYTDGTGVAGPYVHDLTDAQGSVIGRYSLDITPPPVGSTEVIIKSTGTVPGVTGLYRKIEARLAIPSWAKFAVVANADMRFGAGTETFGPVHSNGGIHFDGLAHNIVSSTQSTYDDPDHSGGNEFGVHTHLTTTDPLPPAAVPSRPDVFEVGRQFPLPSVDFSGITADLAQMKTDAQASGVYLANSGAQGYRLVLKTNDTLDVYRVDTLTSPPTAGCTDSTSGWGTWSVATQTFLQNYAFPANGIVFAEDNVWVEGQVNTARVTIAAGRFPDNPTLRKDIIVNNDLVYTNYNGDDAVGLIAQRNISVGLVSDTDLRIDAALIAQNGRVGRWYYPAPGGGSNRCSPYHARNSLTLFGMIGTYQRYGFAYTDGTGYATRTLTYDANLLYRPPPSFPLTSSQYTTISWREIK